MMKKYIFSFAVMSLCFAGQLHAQTDVTSTYITNAGFDDASSWVSSNVNHNNAVAVVGWNTPSAVEWSASASAAFGSSVTINGSTVPSTNSNGTTDGGCLFMRLGWNADYAYTQNVSLPVGLYKLTYKVYNNGGSVDVAVNNTKFTTSDGVVFTDPSTSFPQNQWTEKSFYIEAVSDLNGTLNLGFKAIDAKSTDNPSLAYDYVKLLKLEPTATNPIDFSSDISDDWTNGGKIYPYEGVEMRERYKANLYTGEVMSQTYNVPNGLYEAEVYCQANVANWDNWPSVVQDGETTVSLEANDIKQLIPVYNSKTLTQGLKLYTLQNIRVTDGKLTFKVNNDSEGANWHTVKVKSIKLIGVMNTLAMLEAERDANVANAQAIDQTHLTEAQKTALNNAIAAGQAATTEDELNAANAQLNAAIDVARTQIRNYNTAYDQLQNALWRFETDYNQQIADGTNYARQTMSAKAWNDLLVAVNAVTTAMDEPVDFSNYATTAQALHTQMDATDVSIRLYKSYLAMIAGNKALGQNTTAYETDAYTEDDAKVGEAITALNSMFADYAYTQDADFSMEGFLGANLDFSAAVGEPLAGTDFPNLRAIEGWTVKYDGLKAAAEWVQVLSKVDETDHPTNLYIRKNWYDSPVTLQVMKEVALPVGSYTMTYWTKTDGTNIANNLSYYNLGGTQESLATTSTSWVQVTKTFEVSDAAKSFDLSFGFVTSGSGNQPAGIFVDDITLTYKAKSRFQKTLDAARDVNKTSTSPAITAAVQQWQAYENNEGNFASEAETQSAINILNNAVTIAQNSGSVNALVANADFTGGTSSMATQGGGGQIQYPSGWTLERTFDGWNDVFVKEGYLNVWAGTITEADFYQTLSDLPNGQYRLTAEVLTVANPNGTSEVALYGTGESENVLAGRSAEVNSDQFETYTVDFKVDDNSFRFGIRTTSQYFKVRNMQLSYVAEDEATLQASALQSEYFNQGWYNNSDVDLTTGGKYTRATGAILYPRYVNQVVRANSANQIANLNKNVVVDGTCANFVITDKEPLSITNGTFTATQASYERTMANTYGTLILPFAVDSNNDMDFCQLTNTKGDVNTEEGLLVFTTTTHADANTPLLVKKKDAQATGINISATNVTVENTTDVQSTATSANGWTAEGYYNRVVGITDANTFYIASDKFWANTNTLNVSPFRVVYKYSGAAQVNVMNIAIDEDATAITNIDADLDADAVIYNVNGQLVRRKGDTRTLAPGLYIINGKKRLIK